jgi:hypothetical protein
MFLANLPAIAVAKFFLRQFAEKTAIFFTEVAAGFADPKRL